MLPQTVVPMLAKLIPRLASTHDGEVVATARAIERLLHGVGADLHDLVGALTPLDESLSQAEAIPLWQDLQPGRKALLIERLLQWEGLSEFELDFCRQLQIRIGRYARPPTPKQLDVLNQIVTKAWQAGVCA